MFRIHIQVKGLDAPITATVEPGEALLIGRAPDPSRLDWSLLQPQQPPHAMRNPHTDPAHYQCT